MPNNSDNTSAKLAASIARLIELAQQGDIDPWDVQVIEVIDRYLSDLSMDEDFERRWSSPRQGRSRDADLSESGQAFLWASMLVLLKADTLNREALPEEDLPLEEDIETDSERRLPLNLERHLRRRATSPPLQKRPVTLPELIEQLQQMAAALESNAARPQPNRLRLSRREAARTIAELAHNENLTETAMQLELFLVTHWQQLAITGDWLDLEQLLHHWTDTSPPPPDVSPNHDRVGIFWALLLLSAQSKVELSQDEFYQDLKIRTLDEE